MKKMIFLLLIIFPSYLFGEDVDLIGKWRIQQNILIHVEVENGSIASDISFDISDKMDENEINYITFIDDKTCFIQTDLMRKDYNILNYTVDFKNNKIDIFDGHDIYSQLTYSVINENMLLMVKRMPVLDMILYLIHVKIWYKIIDSPDQ